MISASCQLCWEFESGRSIELTRRYGDSLGFRAAWCSDRLMVIPSIGPLRYGHVMLVPREHKNSFAAIEAHAMKHTQSAFDALLAKVEEAFGPCLAFEHGTRVGAAQGGCGIVHAHAHVVPAPNTSLSLPVVPASRWSELEPARWMSHVARLARGGEYLFVRLATGRAHLAIARNVPSQFLRLWASGATDRASWDWRQSGANPDLPALLDWMRDGEPPEGFVRAASSPQLP
jgi:diadenosine tetraphosphate (Ap4A) HIT family hydrolase